MNLVKGVLHGAVAGNLINKTRQFTAVDTLFREIHF